MQRFSAALEGKILDRVPVFCNLLDQGAKELGMSIKEYYSKGEFVAEAQLRMRERYGYDNVWALFYVGKEAELLGCRKIIFAKDGSPNVGEMVIKNYNDIHKLEIPDDVSKHPAFEELLKCINILKDEGKNKYPICGYVTASMTLPAILMGMEKWMQLIMMGPSYIKNELLVKCSLFVRKHIEAYRKAGVNIILYTNAFGSLDIVPLKFFIEQSLPWMKSDLSDDRVDDIAYMCASAGMNQVIDLVYQKLHIRAYHLGPLDEIKEAKNIIDNRALCIGVINDMKLIDWTKEQTRKEVIRMFEAGMPGGRFMFSTQVMPFSIPDENIKVMLDTAFEYGSAEKWLKHRKSNIRNE